MGTCLFLVGKAIGFDFSRRGVANVPAHRPGDARPHRGVARPPDGGGGMGGWSYPHGAPFVKGGRLAYVFSKIKRQYEPQTTGDSLTLLVASS